MKMKIEIYRKRTFPYGIVVDEKAETTIRNIASFEIHGSYLLYTYAHDLSTQLALSIDESNYRYIISLSEG